MKGNNRVRFCGVCRKNVYNLSEMKAEEALAFVQVEEGIDPPCVRFYMRRDGTVITADCPEGRRRIVWRRLRIASLVAFLLALVSAIWSGKARPDRPFGADSRNVQSQGKTECIPGERIQTEQPVEQIRVIMGGIRPPDRLVEGK